MFLTIQPLKERPVKNLTLVQKYLEKLEVFSLRLSQLSLFVMMVLTSIDALSRYFFNNSITGAYEVTEYYLMIILVFLSISYVQKENGHIRLDIIFSKLPYKVQNYLNVIFYLLAAFYFLFIGYQGYITTSNALTNNLIMSGLINFPLWLSYIWVPIGSILIFIRFLLASLQLLVFKNTTSGHEEVGDS